MVCIDPSRVGHLNSIVPADRELHLVHLTSERGGLVVRSSCSDRFKCFGHPAPSLRKLSYNEGMVCVNAFSGLLLPSVELDFVVLPSTLLNRCRGGTRLCGRATSGARRVTLYDFVHSKGLSVEVEGVGELCARGVGLLASTLGRIFNSGTGVCVNRANFILELRVGYTVSRGRVTRQTLVDNITMGRDNAKGGCPRVLLLYSSITSRSFLPTTGELCNDVFKTWGALMGHYLCIMLHILL